MNIKVTEFGTECLLWVLESGADMLVGRDALWEMESVTLVDVTQNIKEASVNLCEECSNDLLHFLMISNKVLISFNNK